MESLLIWAIKQYGPSAALMVIIVIMYYDVKALKKDKIDCIERYNKMERAIDTHKKESEDRFTLKKECDIVVEDFKTGFGRIERKLELLEKKQDDSIKYLGEKQDKSTAMILDAILKRRDS